MGQENKMIQPQSDKNEWGDQDLICPWKNMPQRRTQAGLLHSTFERSLLMPAALDVTLEDISKLVEVSQLWCACEHFLLVADSITDGKYEVVNKLDIGNNLTWVTVSSMSSRCKGSTRQLQKADDAQYNSKLGVSSRPQPGVGVPHYVRHCSHGTSTWPG